jgi:hypothetical protein
MPNLVINRLTKILEASNTITVANSLSFPMVCNMAPNGWRFMSCGCRELDRSAGTEIWIDSTFRHKSGIWQTFAMNSPEALHTKLSTNEPRFPLVTHTVNSDVRFGCYGLLKSGQGAKNFLDRLVIQSNGQISGHKRHKCCWGLNMDSVDHLLSFLTPTHTHVSGAHSHSYGHFGTATCGVSGLLEIGFTNG